MNGNATTLPVERVCRACGKISKTVASAQDHFRRVHGRDGTKNATPCPFRHSEDCTGFVVWYPSSGPFYAGADYGPVWGCLPCRAWVGCHKGTARAKGTVADAPLRTARQNVHRDFDPIWRRGYVDRPRAYVLLAERMQIPADECHIGLFDLARCEQAIAALQILGPELARAAAAERLVPRQ